MSNAAATAAMNRWTGDAMQKRVAGRYAAERRFRFFGLAAVSLSVAFLAFLLINMAWKGLGGFTQTETKLVIDFPRSDLLLDPATLRGPQAEESVASAGLEGVLEQAAVAQFGEGGGKLFGGASARALGKQLIADPTLLGRKAELWLPVSSKADVAAKHDATRTSKGFWPRPKRKARSIPASLLRRTQLTHPRSAYGGRSRGAS